MGHGAGTVSEGAGRPERELGGLCRGGGHRRNKTELSTMRPLATFSIFFLFFCFFIDRRLLPPQMGFLRASWLSESQIDEMASDKALRNE